MNTSPFGELYVFTEFLNQLSFHKRFTVCFEKLRKVRQSSPSQNIVLQAGMIFASGERLFEIYYAAVAGSGADSTIWLSTIRAPGYYEISEWHCCTVR